MIITHFYSLCVLGIFSEWYSLFGLFGVKKSAEWTDTAIELPWNIINSGGHVAAICVTWANKKSYVKTTLLSNIYMMPLLLMMTMRLMMLLMTMTTNAPELSIVIEVYLFHKEGQQRRIVIHTYINTLGNIVISIIINIIMIIMRWQKI